MINDDIWGYTAVIAWLCSDACATLNLQGYSTSRATTNAQSSPRCLLQGFFFQGADQNDGASMHNDGTCRCHARQNWNGRLHFSSIMIMYKLYTTSLVCKMRSTQRKQRNWCLLSKWKACLLALWRCKRHVYPKPSLRTLKLPSCAATWPSFCWMCLASEKVLLVSLHCHMEKNIV